MATKKSRSRKAARKTGTKKLHSRRFPGESAKYRSAREKLLRSEMKLRLQIEAVAAGNTYNRDYHGESEGGAQLPMMNVFVRRNGRIYHTYGTELLFAPSERGQDGRHVDSFWPLWNLFDLTPEGRGTDWYPRLQY
jgi:predicted dithiol-disulfide oxidoreductase (DUF899 family)